MSKQINAAGSLALAQLANVRRLAGAVNHEIHVDFIRESAAGWRERGFEGVRAAAWSLRESIKDIPGASDCYAAAGRLMSACLAVA